MATASGHQLVSTPSLRNVNARNLIEDSGKHSSHLPEEKYAAIRNASPYGKLSNWGIDGFIAKSNDDLRQEMFVMQLIAFYQEIFRTDGCGVWLKTYVHTMSLSRSLLLCHLPPSLPY